MKNPKVSVLMPAYNAEKYIKEAVQSVIDQTFKDWELLIIDDGSKDETYQIAKSYESIDNRVHILKNEKNSGIVFTRNRLVEESLGEYIAWLDSDDICFPYRLEKQVKVLDSDKSISVVGGGLQFFREDKILSERYYKEKDEDARKDIFKFSPVSQPAAMYRKSYVQEVGGYDVDIPTAEDLNLTFKLGDKYKIANIPDLAIKYRQHGLSETSTNIKKMEKMTTKIRFKYLFGNNNYKPKISDFIYNILHYISIFLIPGKLKIWVFNKIRNVN